MAIARTGGLLLVALSGCSDSRSLPDIVVRDSSGIKVVENGMPTFAAEGRLSLDPVFTIGFEGDHEFVEVASGVILDDGNILVGDRRAREVVRVSATGQIEGVIAQGGEGPAEIVGVYRVLGLNGDTAVIQEPLRDFVLVSRDGVLAKTRSSTPVDRTALGVDVRGRIVLGPPQLVIPFPDGRPDRWAPFVVYGLTLPSGELEEIVAIDCAERTSGDIFAPQCVSVVSGGVILHGRNDRAEIRWLNADGRVIQISRWTEARAPASDSLWRVVEEAYHARWDRAMGHEAVDAQLTDIRKDSPGPPPLFGKIVADGEGGIWIADHTSYWGPPATRYRLLRGDGVFAGTVQVPAGFEVLDVRDGLVLGVATNDLGAQGVSLYRLAGQGGSSAGPAPR